MKKPSDEYEFTIKDYGTQEVVNGIVKILDELWLENKELKERIERLESTVNSTGGKI